MIGNYCQALCQFFVHESVCRIGVHDVFVCQKGVHFVSVCQKVQKNGHRLTLKSLFTRPPENFFWSQMKGMAKMGFFTPVLWH